MILGLNLKERISSAKLFKWEPNTDLLVAVVTLILMWLSYYGLTNWYGSNTIASVLIFIIFTNIFLNIIFPVWWVAIYRKKPLTELGITKKLTVLSLIISSILAFWAGLNLPQLIIGVNWVPHLITSALIFWEPLFVFGWLQSRYEKSFGIIPGIILAALSMVLYHIGTLSFPYLMNLCLVYLVLACAMALTQNILTLWPIYWCIGCTVNSLGGGMHFGWDMVAVYCVALPIQLWFIWYANKSRHQLTSF